MSINKTETQFSSQMDSYTKDNLKQSYVRLMHQPIVFVIGEAYPMNYSFFASVSHCQKLVIRVGH